MNIQQVKAFAYSIYLNSKGYKVLKNTKDTPSTFVRAIKYNHGMSQKTLDNFEKYKRITKDFSEPNPKSLKETLFRDNYTVYNENSKRIDYKKQVKYSKYIDGNKNTTRFKTQIHYNDLKKRQLGGINRKILLGEETYTDFSNAFLGYVKQKTVMVKKSLAEIEKEKYYDKFKKIEETRKKFQSGFLSILINNFIK